MLEFVIKVYVAVYNKAHICILNYPLFLSPSFFFLQSVALELLDTAFPVFCLSLPDKWHSFDSSKCSREYEIRDILGLAPCFAFSCF